MKDSVESMQDNSCTVDHCRVLLVEDDEDDRMLGKRELESMSEVDEVVCFSNGAELMAYMKEHGFQDRTALHMTPTIIVADLYMPQVTGFGILEEIKGDMFLEGIPVVLVSSALSPQNARRATALKADTVLKKPFKAEKMREVLKKAWRWPPPEMWTN
jgi:CheY-like chemotaxis protein